MTSTTYQRWLSLHCRWIYCLNVARLGLRQRLLLLLLLLLWLQVWVWAWVCCILAVINRCCHLVWLLDRPSVSLPTSWPLTANPLPLSTALSLSLFLSPLDILLAFSVPGSSSLFCRILYLSTWFSFAALWPANFYRLPLCASLHTRGVYFTDTSVIVLRA